MRISTWRRIGDRGAGAIAVLSAVGLVLAVFGGMLVFVQAWGLRGQAQSAADFAALAAASSLVEGAQVACQQARIVAELNAGALIQCEVTTEEAHVKVAVAGPFGLQLWARARAGAPLV